jgi:hypothetical protein
MSKDKRKDLRLVKPDDEVEPRALDEATDALRRAVEPDALDALDNEALLAMTLGDDVAELDDEDDRAEAEALREALAGRGSHPLAELAGALQAAHAASARSAEQDAVDLELLLAMSLGQEPETIDEDEREDAIALRRALAAEDGHHPEVALATSLRLAARAPELEAADGEALLAMGLGGALDTDFDDDEQREAANLRAALEGEGDHPLARWATALMAARGNLPGLDELRLRRVLNRALDHHSSRKQSRGVVYGAIVALAAGIALFIGSWSWLETQGGGPTAAATPAPIEARSTQELFDPAEPFPARGGESERMGKIVDARAADLRANRFAAWGVR